MTVKSGIYCQPLLLTVTAGAQAPDWDLTGANGVYIGLLTTGADEAKFESTTTAAITSAGASWTITEVANGGGYTTAGIAIPTPAVSVVSGDILKYTMAAAV